MAPELRRSLGASNFGSEVTFELASSGRNRGILLFDSATLSTAVGSAQASPHISS
jgi:hypothetical protein